MLNIARKENYWRIDEKDHHFDRLLADHFYIECE